MQRLFARYIERHRAEFASELDRRTAEELARKELREFLNDNNAMDRFNHRQRIILVAGSFLPQVLSACAWLVSSGVDISCFAVSGVQIGEQHVLVTDTLLPTKSPRDYFLPVAIGAVGPMPAGAVGPRPPRRQLPRMSELLAAGFLNPGDEFFFKKKRSDIARVVDSTYLCFQGTKDTYNNWGRTQSTWSTIDIYHWFVLKRTGELFQVLREKLAAQQQQEADAPGGEDGAVKPVLAAAVAPNGEAPGTRDPPVPLEP